MSISLKTVIYPALAFFGLIFLILTIVLTIFRAADIWDLVKMYDVAILVQVISLFVASLYFGYNYLRKKNKRFILYSVIFLTTVFVIYGLSYMVYETRYYSISDGTPDGPQMACLVDDPPLVSNYIAFEMTQGSNYTPFDYNAPIWEAECVARHINSFNAYFFARRYPDDQVLAPYLMSFGLSQILILFSAGGVYSLNRRDVSRT